VTLRPITESNRAELEAMRVSPRQENFVTTVADSLEEAAEEPDGRAIAWGVYADETPVGFVMISDDVGGPGCISQYLWKLFIDKRHQGRGFGTSTLDLIVEYFRSRPGVSVTWTSAGEGKGSPSLSTSDTASFEQASSYSSSARYCCGST
jgi:GNAT superfamily N-acetyltransferase